ncbi:baseplate J/gp47 family protein [Clostridium saccharoperbutylacetonicum]|uniref:baseplate J/gp47 family protein n=1 Tax=Clostridium saccharoperbutylacetonicum TaxID=36745 RepID=UPI000983B834|nr:baseplate J/gp47 family protein [Clostridium saccharoperbutylacetonicum]AQR98106.1 baseplate J-like protein [Clostridium saccharoperbutylacetonicum]NSB34000.1 putative phage protein gp47/JayE [Clostridium saccharoperbutylacetonicum]
MADSSAVILNRMLSNVDPSYDTSNGSFFYDFNAPMSIELSEAYKLVEDIITRRNIATSTGDYLTELCSEEGIDRHLATYSVGQVILKGLPGAIISPGDLVSSGLINFEILESAVIIESGQVMVNIKSKTLGSIGNVPVGSITSFPKTLTGITEVTNAVATTSGYDQESDDSLKERYYIKVRTPATSGNPYHYLQWARDVVGVGSAKVFDTWNGWGSVKVVIADSNKRGANQDLIDQTFNYIESVRPIGANVTVISAIEKPLNVTASITLQPGGDLDTVKAQFSNALEAYLKSVAFNTAYISIAFVGNLLLDTGIKDYTNLMINGKAEPVTLTEEEIAVIGSVTFS